jgi:hypothetical protein
MRYLIDVGIQTRSTSLKSLTEATLCVQTQFRNELLRVGDPLSYYGWFATMVEAATENFDYQAHIWNLAHANVHQAIRLTDDKNQHLENLEKLPSLFKDICVSFHGAFTDSLAVGHMLKQPAKTSSYVRLSRTHVARSTNTSSRHSSTADISGRGMVSQSVSVHMLEAGRMLPKASSSSQTSKQRRISGSQRPRKRVGRTAVTGSILVRST